MAEPQKQQIGDGADNYGQAASQAAKATKQIGERAAQAAAAKGVEAGANAAAATVQAGVEGGKAVAEVAAGTATGGPWGAIISAAWALRHTLFKILVCLCLCVLFFIIMIISLPGIIIDSIFGIDGAPPVEGATLESVYMEMSGAVSDVVDDAYDKSLSRVEEIIEDGGYDYDLSMEALINHAYSSAGYDVSYILAAYSASMQQRNTDKADMVAKLNNVSGNMFPVTYEEKETERKVPVTYFTYKSIDVTVVTKRTQTGTINGIPQYRYETAKKTYYLPDEQLTSDTDVQTTDYTEVTVSLPVYSGGKITGMRSATYYQANGETTLSPETEIVKYVECTIHPFNNSVITDAFGIDLDATYDQFNISYREAIQNMADSLKMTLYGSLAHGEIVPLTDAELIAFVNMQDCNATRKHILTTALSLVGKVPYFWGGKSAAGWNDEWNTPRLVTSSGSSSSGQIRPYGLDCSGFTDWVFKTAVGTSIRAGSSNQWNNSFAISKEELLPGDLGFMAVPGTVSINHVLMYAGKNEAGEHMWVHCSSSSGGVVLNSPSYVTQYRRPANIDFEAPVYGGITGDPLYDLEVEVTHYCACSKCCGSNADGITASGKSVAIGMVAMSSHYPFGTQIMIGGTMYTVEDRGGSGIENNIHRVDIFVPDHKEALRLGRYTTTATIYRLGR